MRAKDWAQRTAQWLVRAEFVLLSGIYAFFVVTDQVPLVAFGVVALVWMARWRTTGKLLVRTPLDLPIVLILLWLPINLWVSTNWWSSLPKVYGIVLGVAFFYGVTATVQTVRDAKRAVFWLTIAFGAIALAGLLGTDWAQDKIVSVSYVYDRLPRLIQGIPRSVAGGFARNGVGGTLALTIPLLGALCVSSWKDWRREPGSRLPRQAYTGAAVGGHRSAVILVFALVLSLVTLALTQSRGAILGTFVGLIALMVWRVRKTAWIVAAVAIFLSGAVALGQGGVLAEFLLRMDAKSGTLASRLEVWQRGIWMLQDFPITGIGIGTYNDIAHRLYPFFIAAPDEIVAHAHNNLLQVGVDLGIPALIAFVALLTGFVLCAAYAYRAIPDRGVRAILGGLVFGMLAHQTFGFTDAFILGTKPGVLIWIFIALAAAMYQHRFEMASARTTADR